MSALAFERTRAKKEWPFARAEPDDQPSGSARCTQGKNFYV
jgi:hypothetical protein